MRYLQSLICAVLCTVGYSICADWDHVTYTRQWAQAVCLSDLRSHRHKCCYIPSNVSDWTIHGVWPSKGSQRGPIGCQCSSSFDPTKLLPIEDALKKVWPTLFPELHPDSMNSFWQHEWEKHGRCGVDKDVLKDEFNYFNTGMTLNRRYNLDQILRRYGISPSNSALYPIADVLRALTKGFEATPVIECVHDKVLDKQYVTQIELCLRRDTFLPVSCPARAGIRNNTVGCIMDMSLSLPIIESGTAFPDGCNDTRMKMDNDTTLYFAPVN